MKPTDELLEQFEQALLSVNRLGAQQVLQDAEQRLGRASLLDDVMTPVLERIGQKWECGAVALSQVYMSGIICEDLVQAIFPASDSCTEGEARIALVTFEDYHVLGKRIVGALLKANGVRVMDYGHGVQADELVQKATEDQVDILLISTLMFPSALRIKLVRDAFARAGRNVTIIVGGAPFRFDDHLWQRVGADAMGRTASDALTLIRQFQTTV